MLVLLTARPCQAASPREWCQPTKEYVRFSIGCLVIAAALNSFFLFLFTNLLIQAE